MKPGPSLGTGNRLSQKGRKARLEKGVVALRVLCRGTGTGWEIKGLEESVKEKRPSR